MNRAVIAPNATFLTFKASGKYYETARGHLPQDVFRPFYRVDDSRNRETGGVGLGLTVARSIIRSHSGEVTLADREEGGLRVTVNLPL